jgi:hypothetical protein
VKLRRVYAWLAYGMPLRVDGDLRRSRTGILQEWGDGRWHDVQEPPSEAYPSGSYIELPKAARARRERQQREES